MAAPLAHIFLAAKMLTGLLKGFFDEKEFIIGTSFPDIRYLKVIERSKTHANHVSLEIIMQEKDSFKAGMLFHSFVDEQREHYITMHKLYEKLPCFKFTSQALKFAEDALLRINWDCTDYVKYFDTILEQEKSFGISTEHIKLWHSIIQKYLQDNCSPKELMLSYFDIHEPTTWRIKRWIFVWFYVRRIENTVSFIIHNEHIKKP